MPKTQGIRHRADGRWELRMRLDGVRRSFFAKSYQEACDLKADKGFANGKATRNRCSFPTTLKSTRRPHTKMQGRLPPVF